MHLHFVDYILWVIAPCLQTSIVFFMWRRGLAAELPWFYRYTIFQVVSDGLLFGIQPFSYAVYFYAYWAAAAITVVLTFALIDELFRLAFRNLIALRNLGSRVFRWAVLLLLLAVYTSGIMSHHGARHGWSIAILLTDRIARGMLCALAILLLLVARLLRLLPRTALFGIALGFAIYMSSKVVLDSYALRYPFRLRTVDRISSAVYIVSCLLWLLYVAYGAALSRMDAERESTGLIYSRATSVDSLNAMVETLMRNQKSHS